MFKYLLISKYLRRKLAPLFAAIAVLLCTAMVITVMSVMGGFLDLLRASAQQLTGDVILHAGTLSGMPYYEALMEELERQPEVVAVTPVVRGYGLIRYAGRTLPVEVEGVDPKSLDRIVGFRDTLMWDGLEVSPHLEKMDLKEAAMAMRLPDDWPMADDRPTLVMGIEVNPYHRRDEKGQYNPASSSIAGEATLTILPVSQQGAIIDVKPKRFVVVNEFKSGLYEVDANRVYVDFKVLQRMLLMNEAPIFDLEAGGPTGEMKPARVHEILVKSAPGTTVEQTQAAAERVVRQFAQQHGDMLIPMILTWEERHRTLLSAVQNEKGLVTFLFMIISVVAVVMVATTFYMIVLEKTRDIGVLRAIGASRISIMGLFLGYGFTIGTLGALLGFALAAAIVTHLNEIQTLLNAWFGWQMWDPRVYFFDRIPDTIDLFGASFVVVGAILSSVIGALIPAILAARLNPVEALRYE